MGLISKVERTLEFHQPDTWTPPAQSKRYKTFRWNQRHGSTTWSPTQWEFIVKRWKEKLEGGLNHSVEKFDFVLYFIWLSYTSACLDVGKPFSPSACLDGVTEVFWPSEMPLQCRPRDSINHLGGGWVTRFPSSLLSENDIWNLLFGVKFIVLANHGTVDSFKIFSHPTKHEIRELL